jgi:hypothetical protein
MMGKILRSNDDSKENNADATSAFAKLVLSKVGGSCVYIEPKKTRGALIDTDEIK